MRMHVTRSVYSCVVFLYKVILPTTDLVAEYSFNEKVICT